MKIIEVNNLSKSYKDFKAVDDISFSINKGEIVAFLGPNGAGKSTTIKMLITVLKPSSGMIMVNGYDVLLDQNAVRKSIGIVFQDVSVDDELTAYENMEYHAILYGIPKSHRKEKIDIMLEHVGLIERKKNLVKTFSGGMKRRLEIARGLLHEPEVLFLDEPTLGLDVQTRSFLWNHVMKLNKIKETTVFFTTHNIDEAEKAAKKIFIIDKGKIIASGTSEQIRTSTYTDSLENAFLKLTGYDIRKQSSSPMDRMRLIRKI
ncbi:MAG: multidrug ABC transporter ATP-binding protein [delta proteobacterium ML8_D]|jgi:ABC-2 type transport system ATP-binding protein|nr:MAG: multidrug ABC transporter ATP-binding protein [delta proteobacterium ML8_D]